MEEQRPGPLLLWASAERGGLWIEVYARRDRGGGGGSHQAACGPSCHCSTAMRVNSASMHNADCCAVHFSRSRLIDSIQEVS